MVLKYIFKFSLKVAIVLLALVAVAAADSYGKQHVDYSHVPYYNVDWAVQDDEHYNDYAQSEVRNKDETKTNWRVILPGKGSHIKRDDQVNAEMRVSHAAHASYAAPKAEYAKEY